MTSLRGILNRWTAAALLALAGLGASIALAQEKYSFPLRYREDMRYSTAATAESSCSVTVTQGGASTTTESKESWEQRCDFHVLQLNEGLPDKLDLVVTAESRTTDGVTTSPRYLNLPLPLLRNPYGRCSIDRKRMENEEIYSDEQYDLIFELELSQLSNLFDQLEVNDEIYLPRKRRHPNGLDTVELAVGEAWDIDRENFIRHAGLRNGEHFTVDSRSLKATGKLASVQDGVATLVVTASFKGAHLLFDECAVDVRTEITIRYDLERGFPLGSDAKTDYQFTGRAGDAALSGSGALTSTLAVTVHDSK